MEVASSLPGSKIVVKGVLSASDRLDYVFLNETAKNLGYRFVWHHAGRFVVRWRETERAYAIKPNSDLSTILASLKDISDDCANVICTEREYAK